MQDRLELDAKILDRARISRDARFDGKFFIGVTSTGIYCRPICPSRTSKPTNVRYYPTAAAAAEAGFRPCLRCRPEAAPGTAAWLGTSAVVNRALRMINEGALDQTSVERLATRLGVSSRHLHRLFMRHVGASPLTVAQTRRLHFAKRLLDETRLPVTQIALASGFGSLRRFNDAFRATFRRTPRELRARGRISEPIVNEDRVTLKLPYRPPFDWAYMMRFMAAIAIEGVEHVTPDSYMRTLATPTSHALVHVLPLGREHALELRISGAETASLVEIATAARRVFDLTADSGAIDTALRADPLLAPLIRLRPGLRIPGAWDPFECAIRCLASQRASREEARRFLNQLVVIAGGITSSHETHLSRTFPTAGAIAAAELGALDAPEWKRQLLRRLAQSVVDNRPARGDSDAVVQALASIPEVSQQTLQAVALHALSEPDAFPVDDRILCSAASLARKSLSSEELIRRADAWRPWRGYAAVHLWAASISSAGRTAKSFPARRERLL
jgi:AraC family transcriptional regulator of adaptative response / DNA-3-methyladenine glycosylase II